MRYIISPDKDGIQFGDYLDALASYRDLLPPEVAHFASDQNRFTLSHPGSLHDAWIEQIVVTESRSTSESASEVRIVLTLLGQMHDRKIILTYEGVTRYAITGGKNQSSTPDTLHGDICTHEVRLSARNEVIHEIAIGEGGTFEVTCATFHVEELAIQVGERG